MHLEHDKVFLDFTELPFNQKGWQLFYFKWNTWYIFYIWIKLVFRSAHIEFDTYILNNYYVYISFRKQKQNYCMNHEIIMMTNKSTFWRMWNGENYAINFCVCLLLKVNTVSSNDGQ